MSPDLNDRIVVFAGPSLPTAARPPDDIFAWLPPAIAGDAVALADVRPRAVVLIDGLFDSVPAIRHKELLTLVARGIPLIGGASMGALRAAELHTLGMIGVGRIFDAFASGLLTGDDEVAVVHGPEDWDWTPLTEALVNVRATVLRAVRQGVVGAPIGRRMTAIATNMFYKDRTWPRLLDELEDRHIVPPARSRILRDWLVTSAVNLKQQDAEACLRCATDPGLLRGPRRPYPPDTIFARDLIEQVNTGVRRR